MSGHEQRLMDAITQSISPKPKGKEIKESFAFVKKVLPLLCTSTKKGGAKVHSGPEVVVDVAGSHGMVGLLFAAFRKAAPTVKSVVIVDPHRPKSYDNVLDAWKTHLAESTITDYDERGLVRIRCYQQFY